MKKSRFTDIQIVTELGTHTTERLRRDFDCLGIDYNAFYPGETRLQALEILQSAPEVSEYQVFFYHSDHASTTLSTSLGSSSFITDANGDATQHLQYLPFGEDLVHEQNTAAYLSPYTFSGKERDVETNLSYFGARYYEAGLSIWLSVDPLSDKYPSLSAYNYCALNPVMLVDPDGREIDLSLLIKVEKALNINISSKVINDLSAITGLNLSVNENGKLQYEKNENGSAVFRSEGTSASARSQLTSLIDDTENVIHVGRSIGGEKSAAGGNEVLLGEVQINDFINGTSPDLDNRTMGFGMVFLHELMHTDAAGGAKAASGFGSTGPVVDHMNKVRKELGDKWGQRLSYTPKEVKGMNGGTFIPFSQSALQSLKADFVPSKGFIRLTK